MEIDPDEMQSLYRPLGGAVVPRPIAWVSSTSGDGVDNLAPFSFFNVVATGDPPVVMFAPTDDSESPEGLKDTPRNVRETEEFVVNIVTEDVAEAMNQTSAGLPPGESEFDHADVTRADSRTVSPPRVAESPVNFECSLYEMESIGGSSMVLGEVEWIHLDDGVTTDGKMDTTKLDAVGRLSGSLYTTIQEKFSMDRPE